MSVWNKIKGALVEEDPAKASALPAATPGMPQPPAVAAESAAGAIAPPAPYYPPPPVAPASPTVEYAPPPPSPRAGTPSPIVIPPSPTATVGVYGGAIPTGVLSPQPEFPARPLPSPAIGVPVSPKVVPGPTSGVAVNLEQIQALYQELGVPRPQYSAEQALRFLNTLPTDQPLASRRSALLGLVDSLRDNFPGLSNESLSEDARVKIAALEQAGQMRAGKLGKLEADMEREIESLREQIEQRQVAVEARRVQDQQLASQCQEHAERLKKLIALIGSHNDA
jgi:hypothetical protein